MVHSEALHPVLLNISQYIAIYVRSCSVLFCPVYSLSHLHIGTSSTLRNMLIRLILILLLGVVVHDQGAFAHMISQELPGGRRWQACKALCGTYHDAMPKAHNFSVTQLDVYQIHPNTRIYNYIYIHNIRGIKGLNKLNSLTNLLLTPGIFPAGAYLGKD